MDKDKKICVFDIEGNSLNPDKIWVVSAAIFSNGKWRLKSTTDYDEMRSFFLNTDTLIGHNITLFDIPAVERILDIKIKADLIDTLPLSWYLEPYRMRHGLAWWGEDFGIPKPVIQEGEWEGALPHETQEEFLQKMTHRCEEDVKINCKLIDKQWKDLNNLYDGDKKAINRLVKYLMFKIDCAREAEKSGWRVDIDRCNSTLEKLIAEKEEKVSALTLAMPKVKKYAEMWKPDELYKKPKTYKKPATFQKKDGELSAAGKRYKAICDSVGEDAYTKDSVTVQSKELNAQGIKWMDLLESQGLPETHEDPITYLKSEKEPNPNSHTQTKDWLFELGWKPETFTFKREADGSTRKIEQVRKVVDGEKVLCNSVKKLIEKEPAIELLGGLSILSHRIPILQGFLKNADSDGYLQAQIQGLTNTLRFKHKVVVNLPSVGKPYGEDVRGCLIAPEGYELCGSDMSSLEDRTKQHYMWDYDPEYVKEMQTEDFDPHLDLAVVAGFLTEEQAQLHKSGVKKFGGERAKAKTANYACLPINETEVLTKRGWKFVSELGGNKLEDIMLYNPDIDKLEFGKPTHYHYYKSANTVKLRNNNWEVTSTANHRWIGKRRTGRGNTRKFLYNTTLNTEDINSEFSILNSAKFNYNTFNSEVSNEEFELLGFILSDGHLNFNSSSFSVSQSSKKYLNRLLKLVDAIGVKYSRYLNNSGVDVIGLPMAYARDLYSRLGIGGKLVGSKHDYTYVEQILNCSLPQMEYLLKGFWLGDGNSLNKCFKKDTLEIRQNRGNIRGLIYTIGVLLGKKVTSKTDLRMTNSRYTSGQKLKRINGGVSDVFCYTVPTGYFLIRQNGITTITGNCVYGAGGATVARAADIPTKEGKVLVEKYWVRNWSVKQIAEDQKVKRCLDSSWLYNPVSRFWYSLRTDKDRFSTLNQGTGVFCFDMWIYNFRQVRPQLTGQMHDEVILTVKKGYRDEVTKLLKDAIQLTNKQLKLNRELDVDVQFGDSYAEIH